METFSDNLIHFLGRAHIQSPSEQFNIFTSIIETGLRTSPIKVSFPEAGAIHNSVVCFTDLPLKFCDRHTSIYGQFGIGFKKSFVKNAGGNPAMYFVDHMPVETCDDTLVETRGVAGLNFGIIQKFVLSVSKKIDEGENIRIIDDNGTIFGKNTLKELKDACIYSLSFLKEVGDLGNARDDSIDIDPYYKEREWRLVPSKLNELNKTICNINNGKCNYLFKRNDVNCVIVPNTDMRMIVNDYFKSLGTKSEPLSKYASDPPPVFVYDDLKKW